MCLFDQIHQPGVTISHPIWWSLVQTGITTVSLSLASNFRTSFCQKSFWVILPHKPAAAAAATTTTAEHNKLRISSAIHVHPSPPPPAPPLPRELHVTKTWPAVRPKRKSRTPLSGLPSGGERTSKLMLEETRPSDRLARFAAPIDSFNGKDGADGQRADGEIDLHLSNRELTPVPQLLSFMLRTGSTSLAPVHIPFSLWLSHALCLLQTVQSTPTVLWSQSTPSSLVSQPYLAWIVS